MGISLESDTARYIKAYYDLLCEKKCPECLLNAAQGFEAELLGSKKIV